MDVSLQFSFLNKNGLILETKYGTNRVFATAGVSGIGEFITQDKIFATEREKLFPRDILIVQCSIWIKNVLLINRNPNISVQSIFKLNHRSFFWSINGFSALGPEQRNQFVIMNESKKVLMSFSLVSGFEREINLVISSWDESLKSFSFDISVLDVGQKKIDFGRHTFLNGDFNERNTLLISREQLMDNADCFLPNDVLSLVCDYTFSTGTILHISEEKNFGIISFNNTREMTENENVSNVSQNEFHQIQALVHDLKSMYTEAILSDIELRTSTQTFWTHKSILSARSDVFRRMFSNDMREKYSGHVDIIDLEDDTVHEMLTYIYTNALEDLQFESACQLYSAADKYAIFPLKDKCSYFLKEKVCPTNVCELVSLAYRHQDEELKRTMEDYILDHSKEVFGSREWKNFMATNLQLAADIMYRKVYPN
ncbi:Speckle-type POZ protein like [Argiope bruennichi]|uniref:Speckle-type POZ protein like n=1 Tax=Argiope bruennichi TaxID=94029 RepID=A0A8T0EBG6_ARGBR|nr:Speckle-type POZ protein like [Argiope bruennichi]